MKTEVPVYREGQIVCMFVRSSNRSRTDKWYFGKIFKILPKKSGTAIEETAVEMYQYGVPETYRSDDKADQWEFHYPSVCLTREMVMLARLAAKMPLRENDRYETPVSVRMKDLCPADFYHFRERLTEGWSKEKSSW